MEKRFCEILRRHGTKTRRLHTWTTRQSKRILKKQLPVGNPNSSSQQPQNQSPHKRKRAHPHHSRVVENQQNQRWNDHVTGFSWVESGSSSYKIRSELPSGAAMTRNASIFAKVGILRVKEFHAPPIAEDFGAVERRRFQGVCDACRMEP